MIAWSIVGTVVAACAIGLVAGLVGALVIGLMVLFIGGILHKPSLNG